MLPTASRGLSSRVEAVRVRPVTTDADDRPGVFVRGRRSSRRIYRRVQRDAPRRAGKHAEEGHELGVVTGLAALSLDALSSVAYGPEAIVTALSAAGLGALGATAPVARVSTGMLGLLVVS